LKNFLADDLYRDVTVEDIASMKYLDIVIRETMRMFPGSYFDLTINGAFCCSKVGICSFKLNLVALFFNGMSLNDLNNFFV
jgi:hypothetical protein